MLAIVVNECIISDFCLFLSYEGQEEIHNKAFCFLAFKVFYMLSNTFYFLHLLTILITVKYTWFRYLLDWRLLMKGLRCSLFIVYSYQLVYPLVNVFNLHSEWNLLEDEKISKVDFFSDIYLKKIVEEGSEMFTVDQLVYSCMDVFMAGSETTSKTQEVWEMLNTFLLFCWPIRILYNFLHFTFEKVLDTLLNHINAAHSTKKLFDTFLLYIFLNLLFIYKFGILLMIHHPDIQAKIHEELDAAANGRTTLTMADKVTSSSVDCLVCTFLNNKNKQKINT